MKKIENHYQKDFPIFAQIKRDKPFVYLDNAASTQKPECVISAMSDFYRHDYANIHRGIYELSERATKRYEEARSKVQQFIHAAQAEEIVFVRGTTEAINLIAQCFSQVDSPWQEGDEVIISTMEHHANIVPWYLLQKKFGLVIKVIPISDAGEIDFTAYQQLFSSRTKLVSVTHASNVLGTINPIKEMIDIAHQQQVPFLVDGAQMAAHHPIDVQALDCDFYVFSAHKLYGPTGVGVLYGKKHWLDAMPPYQGGGDMIETVAFDKVTFAKTPQKFEAGTPPIVEVIGLEVAIDYIQAIGTKEIIEHENNLLHEATEKLSQISGLRLLGTAKNKLGVISFVMNHIHPHDVGTVLDHEGIAVRAGHHCAMPLMARLQVPATVRASFGIYNSFDDIDRLIAALELTKRLFQ